MRSQQTPRTEPLPQQASTAPAPIFSQLEDPERQPFLPTDLVNRSIYEAPQPAGNTQGYHPPTTLAGTKSDSTYQVENQQNVDDGTEPLSPSLGHLETKNQLAGNVFHFLIPDKRNMNKEKKFENTVSLTAALKSRTNSEARNLTKGFHDNVEEINVIEVKNDTRQQTEIREISGYLNQPVTERIIRNGTEASLQKDEMTVSTSQRVTSEHNWGQPLVNIDTFYTVSTPIQRERTSENNPVQDENEPEVKTRTEDLPFLKEKHENPEKRMHTETKNNTLILNITLQEGKNDEKGVNISEMMDTVPVKDQGIIIPTKFLTQESRVEETNTTPVLEEEIHYEIHEDKKTITEITNISSASREEKLKDGDSAENSEKSGHMTAQPQAGTEDESKAEEEPPMSESITEQEVDEEVVSNPAIHTNQSNEDETRTSPFLEEDDENSEVGWTDRESGYEEVNEREPIHNSERSGTATAVENAEIHSDRELAVTDVETTAEKKEELEIPTQESNVDEMSTEDEDHEGDMTVRESASNTSPSEGVSENGEPIQDLERGGNGAGLPVNNVQLEETEEEKYGLEKPTWQTSWEAEQPLLLPSAQNITQNPNSEEESEIHQGVKEGEVIQGVESRGTVHSAAAEVLSEELRTDEQQADLEAEEGISLLKELESQTSEPSFKNYDLDPTDDTSVSEEVTQHSSQLTPSEEFEAKEDQLEEKNFKDQLGEGEGEQESNTDDSTESANQDFENEDLEHSSDTPEPDQYGELFPEPTTPEPQQETVPSPLADPESQSEDDLKKRGNRLVPTWNVNKDSQTLESFLPSVITTNQPHNSVARSDSLVEDEDVTTVAPADALMPMIPVVVHDLRSGIVSDAERKILTQVFGDRWPSIELLARKRPISPNLGIEAQLLEGGQSKPRPERDVHYLEVLTDYLEKNDGNEYA